MDPVPPPPATKLRRLHAVTFVGVLRSPTPSWACRRAD